MDDDLRKKLLEINKWLDMFIKVALIFGTAALLISGLMYLFGVR